MASWRTAPMAPGWSRIRLAVLHRDNYRCAITGCTVRATDVDHIIPASRGGSEDPTNLQAMCRAHHATKTGQEARRHDKRARPPEAHPGAARWVAQPPPPCAACDGGSTRAACAKCDHEGFPF